MVLIMKQKKNNNEEPFSRRERQIMDILYREKEATVALVRERMHNEISYSSVRAFLSILEKKGYLTHKECEGKYVYTPLTHKIDAAENSIERLLTTFFGGSVEDAVCTLINIKRDSLSDESYNRISKEIARLKKEKKS